jgi:hypothetical protein
MMTSNAPSTGNGESGKPRWAQPAPVLRRTGIGFDTEARIVTPDFQSDPPSDDWPPVFASGQSPRSDPAASKKVNPIEQAQVIRSDHLGLLVIVSDSHRRME